MSILTHLNRVRVYNKLTREYDVYPVFDSREGIAPLRELYLEATLVTTRGALAHFRAQQPVFVARLLRRCVFYKLFLLLLWWYLGFVFC